MEQDGEQNRKMQDHNENSPFLNVKTGFQGIGMSKEI